jgi:hypothetical protein
MLRYRLIHRVVPYDGEDIIGFLIRVAHRNHIDGPVAILNPVLGDKRTLVATRDLPRLADYCRNYLEEILHLSGIEIRLSDGSRAWQIAGELVSKPVFFSMRRVKVCPACLNENAYIRGFWSLGLYTCCAWHEVHLVDHCAGCGRHLFWGRRRVTHCTCGFDLRESPTTKAGRQEFTVARLIGRQFDSALKIANDVLVPQELDRLADLSLDGLCKTIWFLGHCLADIGRYSVGHGRLHPTSDSASQMIANAFRVLNAWPESLRSLLTAGATRETREQKGSLLERQLGPVQRYLHEDIGSEELAFIRVAYEQHIRMLWRTFGVQHRLMNAERQRTFEFD